MKGLSAREKILITAATVVAALALAWLFIAEPMLADWKKQETKIERLSGKAAVMEAALKDEKQLARRETLLEKRSEENQTSANALQGLLERADKLAGDTGIDVTGVTPMPDQEYDFYRIVSARLDIECTLKELVELLYSIKLSAPAMDVPRMEIGPKDRDSNMLRGYIEISSTVFSGNEKGSADVEK